MIEVTPELSAAIEGVLLHRARLLGVMPSQMLGASTLAEAIEIGGNGPAVAAWSAWQAIKRLDEAWQAVQPPPPPRGSAAERDV